MIVLHDGWPLVYQANHPAALHLVSMVAQPLPGIRQIVALPGSIPTWLPEEVEVQVLPVTNTGWGRLDWETRGLPGLAKRLKANVLHLTHPAAAVLVNLPCVLSPAGYELQWDVDGRPVFTGRPPRLPQRLHQALARGGMERLRAVLWPAGLPAPVGVRTGVLADGMPPVSQRIPTRAALQPGLPEAYVLFYGSMELGVIENLLAAWSWVAGPVGESYPLVIAAGEHEGAGWLHSLLVEHNLEATVKILGEAAPAEILGLVQNSAAVVQVGPLSPWGNSVSLAMRSAVPVVAFKSALTGALVGPAGYLAPEGDTRTLGAGLITVLVEPSISEGLAKAGQERLASWSAGDFYLELERIYRAASQNN